MPELRAKARPGCALPSAALDGDIGSARQGNAQMAHWLMKSEPNKFSYDDLVRDGKTVWDGVRNNQAALYLKAMKVGDEAFFYHSQIGLEVVAIAKVVREAFLDPSDPAGRFVAVEVAPVRKLKTPVSLAQMKANPALAQMKMFKQFRLSVCPIEPAEWTAILAMAGEA
jgi:predicted RNA-binding protein with PUA-like domain